MILCIIVLALSNFTAAGIGLARGYRKGYAAGVQDKESEPR